MADPERACFRGHMDSGLPGVEALNNPILFKGAKF